MEETDMSKKQVKRELLNYFNMEVTSKRRQLRNQGVPDYMIEGAIKYAVNKTIGSMREVSKKRGGGITPDQYELMRDSFLTYLDYTNQWLRNYVSTMCKDPI